MTPAGHADEDGLFFGSQPIRAAQRRLYRDRDFWAAKRFTYSQGRTLGIVGLGPDAGGDRLADIDRAPRLLLHGWSDAARRRVIDRLDRRAWGRIEPIGMFARPAARAGPAAARAPLAVRLDPADASWIPAAQAMQDAAGIVPVPGWILAGRDGRTVTLGIVADGRLHAVACVQRVDALLRRGAAALLFGVSVDGDCRGQGLGAALLDAAAHAASALDTPWLCEMIEPGNDAAAALAAKTGFVRCTADWALFVEHRQANTANDAVAASGGQMPALPWRRTG